MSRRTRRLLAEAAGIMELSVTEMETLEEEQLYIYFLLLLFMCGGGRWVDRSQEFCVEPDEFEMHFRLPSGDVEQVSGFRSWGRGRNLSWTHTRGHHQQIHGASNCGIACGDVVSRCRQKR